MSQPNNIINLFGDNHEHTADEVTLWPLPLEHKPIPNQHEHIFIIFPDQFIFGGKTLMDAFKNLKSQWHAEKPIRLFTQQFMERMAFTNNYEFDASPDNPEDVLWECHDRGFLEIYPILKEAK
jgi:hypothetical protein